MGLGAVAFLARLQLDLSSKSRHSRARGKEPRRCRPWTQRALAARLPVACMCFGSAWAIQRITCASFCSLLVRRQFVPRSSATVVLTFMMLPYQWAFSLTE